MHKKGQSLVELLIAIGLLSIFLPALITSLASSREGKAQENQRLQAATLLKEANEVVRSIREKGWTTFAVNGTYHPVISGSIWSLADGPENINGFTRQTVISDVFRDTSGNITATGGTNDPSSKKIVNTVSWNTPFTSSVSSISFLTRYLNNAIFFQSTDTDFNSGTNNGTAVTKTADGEVVLGAGGHGNWCNPNLNITAIDLPKQGVANAIYAIEGHAFTGTGENASGVSFANLSISNPPYPTPPSGEITGTFDGYKTNDGVFGESGFAYLATDNNAKEIVIIDLNRKDANGKYIEAGYFNAPGNGNGKGVYVSGNVGFMITGDKLYSFDLSSKTGSRPRLNTDDITLAGPGSRIIVKDNYIYIAEDSSSKQLQIYNSSADGKSISFVSELSVAGGGAKSLSVTGSRVYLVTGYSSANPDFFIVNIDDKTNPKMAESTSYYNTGGMTPKGITIVPGNKAIIVGTGGEEYQVIDTTDEKNPKRCGGLNIDSGVNGVSSVLESDGDAYSYIITGDSNGEFKMIEGGPGGQFASAGTYESPIMGYPSSSTPSQISLNRFIANISKTDLNNLKIQVGATDAVNGSCSGVNLTYVGPDGSTGSFFNPSSNLLIEGTIPTGVFGAYKNPGYCYGYKAYLSTTDITSSPVLYDISTNYSP